jgi:NADP-dependent 3-hydroxy acid dehydrogenase YdfG
MPDAKKVALITGASSGMGAATAVRLAKDGYRVAMAARRVDLLEVVAKRVREAGGEPLVIPTDVAKVGDVQKMVQATMDAFGRLDVLFNNAGLMRVGPIEELSHDEIKLMVDVNVTGAFAVVKEVVPILKKQNSGLIINVSSVLGRKTRANAWAYAATKWAITAMNEGLREELVGTHVRVCSLQPGVIDTELFQAWPEHPAKWQNISEMLKPEEMADLIAFIASRPWHFNMNEVLIRPTEQIV